MESNFEKKVLSSKETVILLLSVFIVGFCTIIYELLIGSVSSYFLGDSVKQFSLVIGLSMTAMGIGTLVSRFIHKNLIYWFILIEIILAIIGGLSVPILYFSYMNEAFYYPVMFFLIMSIGILIGLEIPVLTRIMETYYDLRNNISNVLSLDYLGAFIATLAFPFLLLPVFGIFNSSIIAGFLNLIVGAVNFYWFKDKITIKKQFKLKTSVVLICIILVGLFAFSHDLMKLWENNIYEDKVVYSKQTKYQKLVMTKNKDDIRLFIDGNVQFSSIDEHRYHELLVHIPMTCAKKRENILILGGGDGLAAREVLKYNDVSNITVVDLDEEMTELAKKNKTFLDMNKGSFLDEKVNVVNEDAFKYIENTHNFYDVVIIDLPDPNNSSLARLYSREFYKLVRKKMSTGAVLVTQATSPYFSSDAFWCVKETLSASGFLHTYPYHVYVPSFGDWGFVMASDKKVLENKRTIQVETKYLDEESFKKAFVLEKDIKRENIKYSTLDRPFILDYYLSGWRHWG